MKKVKIIFSLASLLLFALGCSKEDGIDDDLSFLNSAGASNISKIIDISTDNSGMVKVTPTGTGIVKNTVAFGHGTGSAGSATIDAGNTASHSYPEGNYTVTVVSSDIAGKQTTNTYPVVMTYRAPEQLVPTIESNANGVAVKAKALYAASFLVYFGDVTGEVATPLSTTGTVYHAYAAAGTYSIKVVAISGNATYSGAARTEVSTSKVVAPFLFKMPITFDDPAVNYFFGTFGGNQQFATVANPNAAGLNTSAKVGKFTRGFDSWSGTYSPQDFFIDMAAGKKIKVLVYNPDVAMIGKKLNIELEAAYTGTPGNGLAILKVPLTKSGEWEELVFDFSTIAGLSPTAKFGQLVLRFNDDFNGDGVGGTGTVIYVDNFRLTN